MAQSPMLRSVLPFFVVSFFLFYFLSSGLQHELSADVPNILTTGSKLPDFGHYRRMATLSPEQLSLDDPDRRAIIVGDIHGMRMALDDLLRQVSYDKKKDTLIHLGDVTAKGSHEGSLAVLSFLSTNNITGVRGNHDQKVIEWRAWMEWIDGLEAGAGSQWLLDLEEKWEEGNLDGDLENNHDTEMWVKTQMRVGQKHRKWWSKIPEGWDLFSDHYRIARAMSERDYEYLLSLPLVLHVPSEHTFFVHAGLLPYDPTHSITSKRQPLAHLPRIPKGYVGEPLPALRNVQELAVLDDIKQNTNPWVVLNIRNLLNDNTVSRKTKKGTAWAELWNGVMSRCAGFERAALRNKDSLPCHPSTVVYGHAASRGLDVHRWTVGLDTGCVYSRKLTALILDSAHSHREMTSRGIYDRHDPRDDDQDDDDDDGAESSTGTLPFGDSGQAQLVSVKCHRHREAKQSKGRSTA